jgi:hypothetical protein
MRRQVDFPEAALPNESSQRIVPHGLQVGRGEFTAAGGSAWTGRRGITRERDGAVLLEELLVRVCELLQR